MGVFCGISTLDVIWTSSSCDEYLPPGSEVSWPNYEPRLYLPKYIAKWHRRIYGYVGMIKRISKSGNTATPILFQVVFKIPYLQYLDGDTSAKPMSDHIFARINMFSANYTPRSRVTDEGFNVSLGDLSWGRRTGLFFHLDVVLHLIFLSIDVYLDTKVFFQTYSFLSVGICLFFSRSLPLTSGRRHCREDL